MADITTVGIKVCGYPLVDWDGFHLFGGGIVHTLVFILVVLTVGYIDNLDVWEEDIIRIEEVEEGTEEDIKM